MTFHVFKADEPSLIPGSTWFYLTDKAEDPHVSNARWHVAFSPKLGAWEVFYWDGKIMKNRTDTMLDVLLPIIGKERQAEALAHAIRSKGVVP